MNTSAASGNTGKSSVYVLWHNEQIVDVFGDFEIPRRFLDDRRKGIGGADMGFEMLIVDSRFELGYRTSQGQLHKWKIERRALVV